MTASTKEPVFSVRPARSLRARCRVLATLVLAAAFSSARGAEYFVSPNGDDADPGSEGRPWRTIDKANNAVRPGDVVTFLPGDYPGVVSPKHNGEPGRPVAYRGEPPLGARLVGGDPVVELQKRLHFVLDGFHVAPAGGRYLVAAGCEHLVIRNCRFEGARGSYTAARFIECRNVGLHDNVFTRLLSTSNGAVLTGNMIQADRCDRLVIEGNTLGHAGHSPAHLRECKHLVVRRNLFCAKWGRGFETFNATPMLFEENVVTEEVDSGGSADSRGKVLAIDGVFRRNLIVRNYDAALASNSYVYREGMPAWVLRNSRLYNNTLYRNHSYAWIITARTGDPTTVSGNVWKNNVFCHNDPLGDFRALRLGHLGEGNHFVRNVLFGDRAGRKLIEKWIEGEGYRRFALPDAERRLGALFSDNFDVDPRFVDADADDYRLSAGSPCIDAGGALTRTARAGEGRVLPVLDARWFYDGFGIAGQVGDLVFVGDDRRAAQVARTDVDNNVLHLDRDVRWRAGEPVSLPYVGRAPDLGAMEHGAEGEPWFYRVTIRPGIRWHPPQDPAAPLVKTEFEDDTIEQWGYVWNLDRKRDTTYARAGDTVASGKFSLRLHATGNRSILGGDVKPRVWELDRHPLVGFAYRIPPGVPVGVWLDCFDTEKHGSGRVCVGGTPARRSGSAKDLNKYQLVDDNQWHAITLDARVVREVFPDVTHLQGFQFYTEENGRQGHEFWVDDFAIAGDPDE
ncbi:MAG: right-handed parallel beta-helix repeat-containing protein [Planctomycetota bacterium]|jgi:hypothetical protein